MKIIIITGQTATGKTKFALELAQKHNGELINCDSRQIYKRLDIITGKEFGSSKVWLYDIVDPKQYFSSYDYAQCALAVIKDILNRGKTPIIVGGTYLYLYHLLYSIETENIPPDWELRKQMESKTVKELQEIMLGIDAQSLDRLNTSDKNNPQRLIRKIEIMRAQILSNLRGLTQYPKIKPQRLDIIKFVGLRFDDKNKLHQAVQTRVKERLKNGAIDEVKKLLHNGYTETNPGLKTIGYKQLIDYLRGRLTKEDAIQQWITKELQYAKRQYTFMKKDPHIKWRIV